MSRRATEFQTIRSEGGLLPPDLLRRIVDPAGKVSGVEPTAYGLPAGERINEAITQSWNRLRRHWEEFRTAWKANSELRIANDKPLPAVPPLATRHSPLAESEAFTGLTNDKWSLPLLRELGFGFLATTAGPTIDGKTYAISRFAGNTAIHLVGCGVDLDRRAAGVRGAAAGNPHGLVQEFLNRSPGHLWAIVSNGISFRILRDNQALSRQSFLEFDLAAMFDGEVYSDFVLLWLMAHASRFLPREKARGECCPLATRHSPLAESDALLCWLETWSKEAAEEGVAALTDLRGGVEKALEILGQGFVSHPKNTALRDALRKGEVKLSDFHHQLLRVVYRLIFLFVAEDRELEGISILHPRENTVNGESRMANGVPLPASNLPPLATRYSLFATHYSTSRLRELASRIKGSRHGDLWRQFQLLVGALSGDARFAAMRNALALPPLGSMLWNPAATALLDGPRLVKGEERGASGNTAESGPHSPLTTRHPPAEGAELSNHDFLEALRHLAFIRKDKILRPVDYKNLGSEEFGGVYESFLALTPQISSDGARFTFAEFAGNERKTSGSYYTPDSLVQCPLDSALDPVVQERLELAARVARSEWRVVSEEVRNNPQIRKYVHSILPRLGGLAARHDAGGTGLQPDESLSEGRTLRDDLTNPTGSSLDSGERSRGLGQGEHSRVPPVPSDRPGQSPGVGNSLDALPTGGPVSERSSSAIAGTGSHAQPAASRPATQPPTEADLARLWNSTPLATRHSLLAETALLSLKVCDPACGSGHFLVGAGHRLARHLARVRALAAGESEPSPLLYQTALRDVIGHCLYGVDINPMAVELCKVTLWLEALEPGKPLSFLDHHIRYGNSLLGATPELIAAGLPDEAFDPIEGDDKAACSSLKKLNRAQREGLRHLFLAEDNAIRDRLRQTAAAIDEMGDSRPEDIQRKEAGFRAEQSIYDFQKDWDLANLWCAAFVIKKRFPDGPSPAGAGEGGHRPGEGRGEEPPTLDAQPLATQGGLFGGTQELPKAKRHKPLPTRHSPLATPYGITTQHLRDFVESGALPDGLPAEAKRLADQYQFFHWHLAFPEVFVIGGFDVSLGNPPWEQVELNPEEFFAQRVPSLANAEHLAAREQLMDEAFRQQPALKREYDCAVELSQRTQHFLHQCGRYQLSSKGRLNLANLFVDLTRQSAGNVGLVVPTTLATGAFTGELFRDLLGSGALVSLHGFDNGQGIFPAVKTSFRFCLLTLSQKHRPADKGADFVFFAQSVTELREQERHFRVSLVDLLAINPNTGTCPVFKWKRDAGLATQIHTRAPVLYCEGRSESDESWGFDAILMFMTNTASRLFKQTKLVTSNDESPESVCWLPFLEAKAVAPYDHRASTWEGDGFRQSSLTEKEDPNFKAKPRNWIREDEVLKRLRGRWNRKWLLLWQDVTDTNTMSRTLLSMLCPLAACGDGLPVLCPQRSPRELAVLYGALNSFVLDYSARQKVGGVHLRFHVFQQLPVVKRTVLGEPTKWDQRDDLASWILPRVLELTYTAWALEPFAQDCGWSGPPFCWDEERRFLLRCELDAAFFHLYLGPEEEWRKQPAALTQSFPTARAAVSYIMDTFPIVKRKDEEKFNGDYRTKRTVLEIYDAMAEAKQTGKAYQTRLNSAPAGIAVAHPPRFDRERLNVDVGNYILAFVFSLLRHHGGECDVMRLARAYALLLQRGTLAAISEAQFGPEARRWVETSAQIMDGRWFLPILRQMDTQGMVALEVRGDDVIVRQKDPQGPPSNAALETDVFLVLRVLDLVPATALAEPVKRMVPKAPRVALQEAVAPV